VIHFYPLSHLLLLSYAENIDRSLIEASSNLGGRVWITISSILVPLLRPAIIAVASLVFILSLEDLVGPIAFSRHNYARNLISYQAYFGFISEYGYYVSPRIASYVLVMVIISVASLLIFHRYLVSSRFGIVSPKRIYVDIGGLWGSLARAFTAILLIFTTLPNILILSYCGLVLEVFTRVRGDR